MSGEETIDSDIDLFLITDLKLREITKTVSVLSGQLKRELNPVAFNIQEFRERIREKDHFILEMINSPKIWIIGNDNEFRKVVKGT